jgi:hypothetical protein
VLWQNHWWLRRLLLLVIALNFGGCLLQIDMFATTTVALPIEREHQETVSVFEKLPNICRCCWLGLLTAAAGVANIMSRTAMVEARCARLQG